MKKGKVSTVIAALVGVVAIIAICITTIIKVQNQNTPSTTQRIYLPNPALAVL